MKHAPLPGEDFEDAVERRRAGRMAMVDDLPPALRCLVHEYGLHVIRTLVEHGVVEPRIIRHLIETVLDELSPTRGSSSSQGPMHRQWIPPKGYRLVPEEPTPSMIDASVDYLDNWRKSLTPDERVMHGRFVGGRLLPGMGNRQKHASRYKAMLGAAPKHGGRP